MPVRQYRLLLIISELPCYNAGLDQFRLGVENKGSSLLEQNKAHCSCGKYVAHELIGSNNDLGPEGTTSICCAITSLTALLDLRMQCVPCLTLVSIYCEMQVL